MSFGDRHTPLKRTEFKRKAPVNTDRAVHPAPPPRRPVKSVSAQRAIDQSDYDELRARLLPPDRYVNCAARDGLLSRGIAVCSGRATELHHRRKRSAAGALANPANVVAVCHGCQMVIEDHPVDAERAGLVVREGHPEWSDLSARAWRRR